MPDKTEAQVLQAAGLSADTQLADDTVAKGWVQRRAIFTVPVGTPDERVQFNAGRYQRKFGGQLEKDGFRVMDMSKPIKVLNHPLPDPTRIMYGILARVTRRPVALTMELPDLVAAELERRGERIS